MPDVFRGIGDPVDSKMTTVMLFTGDCAPYTTATNGAPLAPPFATIQDGTARTIAFVEAGAENAIPWSKPGDLPFDPENPFLTLGDYNSDGAVNAADYTVWHDVLGIASVRPFSGADGNGDSRVDALDHATWRANYGATAS